MSQSTDAILFYGYAPNWSIEDGEPPPWCLHKETDEESLDEGEDFDLDDDSEDDLDPQDWIASFGHNLGVEALEHCSGDFPMYGLAISASTRSASRGDPVDVTRLLTVKPDWNKKLDRFVKLAGLTKKELGKRGWWLCSWWG